MTSSKHSPIKPTGSHHLAGCGADEDPDGATMCVCDSIEQERAAYDPREEIECTPELIDGHFIGCGICEACR